MLTEIYIEALLADEEAADQVFEAWDKGDISDIWAAWMWWWLSPIRLDLAIPQARARLRPCLWGAPGP